MSGRIPTLANRPQPSRTQYKPRPSVAVATPIAHLVYNSNVTQTINNNATVQFNKTTVLRGLNFNTVTNRDDLVISKAGIYEIKYVLTIEPYPDSTAAPTGHVFVLTLNGQNVSDTTVGDHQPNNLTPYQIVGHAVINVTNDNTVLNIKNLSVLPVTLTKSVNSVEVCGATLTVVKLD